MNKIFILIFLSCCSINVFGAHAWDNTKIGRILVHDNGSANYSGIVHVYMDENMVDANFPSCASGQYRANFAINLSRNGAQAQYAALLAAYMADKPVIIDVNNSCIEGIPELRNVFILK